MKKIYLLMSLGILCLAGNAGAQQKLPPENQAQKRKCVTAELLQNFQLKNPKSETQAQFENWIANKILERKANGQGRTVIPNATLPVVFHIIHNAEALGSGRNIPSNLVFQQTIQLNKDFANLSNSPYAVAENVGLQFGLAQTDPLGNTLAEPGIDRIDRNTKGWSAPPYTVGYDDELDDYLTTVIKPNSIWDPTRYLNIWVSEWEAGILGIATFPGSSGLSGLDNSETNSTAGVTIGYETVGSLFSPNTSCTNVFGKGRTLTHELGHFFGLRHIWGDATCGTDYCNDTPTHQSDNGGIPVHPKPNSCGTPDEMFENYMDYCYDVAMNTFTSNQVDRIEVVMANSPRRNSLLTSTVPKVAPPSTNNLAFADCSGSLSTSETSPSTACPKYKDIAVELIIDDKATSTSTININATGSAINGVQYQILTPTLIFNTGDVSKLATIRIFDDAVSYANSTINLGYTIVSGSGITAGSSNQTYTINLIDNDGVFGINNTTPTSLLYSEDFGSVTGSNQLPAGWVVSNATTFTTNKWVVNNAGATTRGFTGNTLHISNGTNAQVTAGTAAMSYSASSASVTTDARAISPTINATGYGNLNLTLRLSCNGEFDGDYYDYGIIYYSLDGTNFTALADASGNFFIQGITSSVVRSYDLPAAVVGTANFKLMFRWRSDNTVQNQPPFSVDDIVLISKNAAIETVQSQSKIATLTSGQTAQYISNTTKIIATIANLNQNTGCITASIKEAGNGFTVINTNAGAFTRSNKVIQLTPATANSSATYQATFYFTTAELLDWGTNAPNLKILKVADGVNLSSTLTAANAQLFTPTFDDQRSTKGYAAYTANFTGGFSQFMLVSPLTALPVTTLSFEARPAGKNIVLNWTTSVEINNKGFVVERSTNGTSFTKIGWVDGAVNSNQSKNYSYADNFVQPNTVYYYRLRQTDIDARENLSEIKNARVTDRSNVLISISPNPAKNQLKVFAVGTTGLSNINLLDAKGQLVQSWKQVNCSATPQTLDISKIAAGVYLIQIINDGVQTTEKVIIN